MQESVMHSSPSDEASRFERCLDTSGTSNPALSLGHLSSSTLSMRRKKQRKREASAHHNSNFHAGYVPVTEDLLHRTGIRGRKRYFLYCTLAVTLIVALVNTLITAWLLYVLGLTHNGLSKMEIISTASRSFFHFFVPTNMSAIAMNRAPLGGLHERSLNVLSSDAPLHVNSYQASDAAPGIALEGKNITIIADDMKIKSAQSRKWLSLDVETMAKTHGISNFYVDSLTTKKIQHYKNVNDLYLESHLSKVNVNGLEAVDVKSLKGLEVTARNVSVESDRDIIFQNRHSVYFDPNMPKVKTPGSDSRQHASKLCMCGNGQLFLVPILSPASSSHACDIGINLAKTVCST